MAKKIILVHGLGGNVDETWGKFPSFLNEDKDLDFDIVSCGYESPSLWKIWKRAPSILNIANGVLTDIKARCNLESDEIILAGHSLGGVIVKKLLLILKNKGISHNIVKVCFFDTPHDGSGFANIGKHIAFRNRHLKSLILNSSELDDLNDQWIYSGLNNSLSIFSIIAANDDIVSSSSSKSIFREHEIETINDTNHLSIVKPQSTNSTSYIVFKRIIQKKNDIARYKSSASRYFNDWKSIERKHSYGYVSDEQRDRDLSSLVEALSSTQSIIRLTGASGLGKSRLLLEAIEKVLILEEDNILVFNGVEYGTTVKENVRSMVDESASGLVVVESCTVDLHNELAKEINKTECQLKVVTIGYEHKQVDDSIHIKLSPLNDNAINMLLTPILVDMNATDVDRVARFSQGYPLMATLIAEQYKQEGRLLGAIEADSVVKKLIDGSGEGVSEAERDVLYACSLFDAFVTNGEDASFITKNIAGAELKVFDRVLRIFTGRQIINRAGRFARLVPKPLALTLASEWWEETPYDKQKSLIDNLPESLLVSFCRQASYLDDRPSVNRFSDRLFGGQDPFVQAGELLTQRGSRLFRAFVEVNQESTAQALYRTLGSLKDEELLGVNGDTRRNLVWGLEKLCFHAEVFDKAAWCMLLLASAENENWSNNSTGMFSQLYRVQLSGTQATPKVRFDLLERAIELKKNNVDLAVLEALKQAVSTYGGSRTVGAEYQGTKAPLEEWRPGIWQEIFDYWERAFDLLISLLSSGEAQKEKALSIIGSSIRGFVNRGRIEMLDTAIKKVVSINGPYWPSALVSIKSCFEYDSNGMNQETKDTLNCWLELLNPEKAQLSDKLKILVTSPPWEHRRDESGNYVDIAAEHAKSLAQDLAKAPKELATHLNLILDGEQKQSYAFGYQLALELEDAESFLKLTLEQYLTIDKPDPRFILGLYAGISERSEDAWEDSIQHLISNSKLVNLYPDILRTGDIRNEHLDILLDLIQRDILPPSSANTLGHGRVTNGIKSGELIEFCLKLSNINEVASWAALNVIYMHCFSNKESITELRDQLKILTVKVPLHKKSGCREITDIHHWHELVEDLLKDGDNDFLRALTNQIISASKYSLDHSDIWSYIKPLLTNIMRDYHSVIWPFFGEAIVLAEGMERYWLMEILECDNNFDKDVPSVLSTIPLEKIIDWCTENPEVGPTFVASCINVFETVNDEKRPTSLFIALLENFGGDEDVTSRLAANIDSGGWCGSRVPYLLSDKEALNSLQDHENSNVRIWIRDCVAHIDKQIAEEAMHDEERNFGIH